MLGSRQRVSGRPWHFRVWLRRRSDGSTGSGQRKDRLCSAQAGVHWCWAWKDFTEPSCSWGTAALTTEWGQACPALGGGPGLPAVSPLPACEGRGVILAPGVVEALSEIRAPLGCGGAPPWGRSVSMHVRALPDAPPPCPLLQLPAGPAVTPRCSWQSAPVTSVSALVPAVGRTLHLVPENLPALAPTSAERRL